MITSATAPTPPKENKHEVVQVCFRGNQMVTTIASYTENDVPVGERNIIATTTTRTGIGYHVSGHVAVNVTQASSGPELLADFNAFVGAPNGFASKAAALEARLLATGRIPA